MSDLTPQTESPAPPPTPAQSPPAGSDVLWVSLWSVLLALGVASGASAWREVAREAAARPAILLPSADPSEAERREWPAQLRRYEGIAEAAWLSPGELAETVSAGVPAEFWSDLFSGDDAWLPWLLRLRFEDPAASPERALETVGALRAESRYRLVLFDAERIQRDAGRYTNIRRGVFTFAGVLLALGALALLLAPVPHRRGVDAVLAGALSVLGILAGGVLLRAFGVPLESGPWWRAGVSGFVLAAVVAPMLKGRLISRLRKRGD
jgi:hypothetical protein